MERMCIQWLIVAHRMAVQGNRDNIDSMAGGSQKILNQVLKLIDQHDLYGSVAYPKKHQQKDISDIYLLPFATRGIFTNVALQEPFGLTVIEVGTRCLSACPGSFKSMSRWEPTCRLPQAMRFELPRGRGQWLSDGPTVAQILKIVSAPCRPLRTVCRQWRRRTAALWTSWPRCTMACWWTPLTPSRLLTRSSRS